MFAAGSPSDLLAIRTPDGSPIPFARDANRVDALDPRSLAGRRVLSLVLVGQSNSANMALGYQYVVRNAGKVLQVDPTDGSLYPYYADPLIGATGVGGHWVADAADRLISAGLYDRVVISGVAAVGGAAVEYFAPGANGTLRHRITAAALRLKDLGLGISAFNFALGESAIGYSEAQFRAPLDAMIASVRAEGWLAPWIMDITTRNTVTTDPSGTNPGARAALAAIVNGIDILAGVDTDDLTYPTYRIDEGGARVHLNGAGCQVKATRKAANITTLASKLPLAA